VAEAQLSNAGLGPLFEKILSTDTVRRLKPAREPYLVAAQGLGVDPAGSSVCVACQGSQVSGEHVQQAVRDDQGHTDVQQRSPVGSCTSQGAAAAPAEVHDRPGSGEQEAGAAKYQL